MVTTVKQNIADRYQAVVPVPASGTFAPGRNANDGDLTAGALAVVQVDASGNPSGGAGTAATTSVPASAASVQALPANPNRRGAIFTNTGGAGNVFLSYGTAATTAAYVARIAPGANYAMPSPVYTGVVNAIWDTTAGAGPLSVTELTA